MVLFKAQANLCYFPSCLKNSTYFKNGHMLVLPTLCQFHQHFTHEFFVQTSFFYIHVTRKTRHSYEKFVSLTLMKLTTGRFENEKNVFCTTVKNALHTLQKWKASRVEEELGNQGCHLAILKLFVRNKLISPFFGLFFECW